LRGSRILHEAEAILVCARIPEIHLTLGQDIGFSTETSHSVQTANEIGKIGGLGALQFIRCRTRVDKARQLLIDGSLGLREILTRPQSGHDPELPGDLLCEHAWR
jgi:hypothetical protein